MSNLMYEMFKWAFEYKLVLSWQVVLSWKHIQIFISKKFFAIKTSYSLSQNEEVAIWSHDKINFLINKREKIMFIHDIEKIGKHIM